MIVNEGFFCRLVDALENALVVAEGEMPGGSYEWLTEAIDVLADARIMVGGGNEESRELMRRRR